MEGIEAGRHRCVFVRVPDNIDATHDLSVRVRERGRNCAASMDEPESGIPSPPSAAKQFHSESDHFKTSAEVHSSLLLHLCTAVECLSDLQPRDIACKMNHPPLRQLGRQHRFDRVCVLAYPFLLIDAALLLL